MEGRPTHELITPFAKAKVVVKDWLTGREREYIDQAKFAQVNAQPKTLGQRSSMDFDKINAGDIVSEQTHRMFVSYIVSIDGKTDNILDMILDMHEDDTECIFNHLAEKKTPTEPGAATP